MRWSQKGKNKGRSLEERFHEKVLQGSPDECWPWLASTRGGGYGAIYIGCKPDGSRIVGEAHKVAWELANQSCVLPGYVVRHFVCDNPPCCNPAHLRPGTYSDNTQDMISKGRGNWARGESVSARQRGELNRMAKLTDRQVQTIRAFRVNGFFSAKELAEIYDVHARYIRRIVSGERRKEIHDGRISAD